MAERKKIKKIYNFRAIKSPCLNCQKKKRTLCSCTCEKIAKYRRIQEFEKINNTPTGYVAYDWSDPDLMPPMAFKKTPHLIEEER